MLQVILGVCGSLLPEEDGRKRCICCPELRLVGCLLDETSLGDKLFSIQKFDDELFNFG